MRPSGEKRLRSEMSKSVISRLRPAAAFVRLALYEARRAATDPRKVIALLDPQNARAYAGYLSARMRLRGAWNEDAGLIVRSYADYRQYLRHQIAKPRYGDLAVTAARFRAGLVERLRRLEVVKGSNTVICIGAGTGEEVAAFRELGCFAVGIDVNPALLGSSVFAADFHHLPFASRSAEIVYSNALDHAFDIRRAIAEARRVLKSDGLVVAEVSKGKEEGEAPGVYEATWWARIDDVIDLFASQGLGCVARLGFDFPWEGETLVFTHRG